MSKGKKYNEKNCLVYKELPVMSLLISVNTVYKDCHRSPSYIHSDFHFSQLRNRDAKTSNYTRIHNSEIKVE